MNTYANTPASKDFITHVTLTFVVILLSQLNIKFKKKP